MVEGGGKSSAGAAIKVEGGGKAVRAPPYWLRAEKGRAGATTLIVGIDPRYGAETAVMGQCPPFMGQ